MLITIQTPEYSQLPRLIKSICKRYKLTYCHFDRWLHIYTAARLLDMTENDILAICPDSSLLHVVGMPDGKAFVHPLSVIRLARKNGMKAAFSAARKLYRDLLCSKESRLQHNLRRE